VCSVLYFSELIFAFIADFESLREKKVLAPLADDAEPDEADDL